MMNQGWLSGNDSSPGANTKSTLPVPSAFQNPGTSLSKSEEIKGRACYCFVCSPTIRGRCVCGKNGSFVLFVSIPGKRVSLKKKNKKKMNMTTVIE